MADAHQIGHKIRRLREARGLSQTKVAKLLNMGQQGYSCYETNIVTIPLDKFLKLCAIFGISTEEVAAIFGISTEEVAAINEHEVAPHVTA